MLTAPVPAMFGTQTPQPFMAGLTPVAQAPQPQQLWSGGVSPSFPQAAPQQQQAPVGTIRAPQPSSGLLSAAAGGIQAGQVGTSAYDNKSAAASILGGAGAGALAGAPAGPWGAAIGGVAGGGVAALNAWMAVGKENEAKRDRRDILRETAAEQKRRDEIMRADALDELSYQRKQVEEAKRLEEWNRNRALIAEASAKKKARADEFIAKGYVT